MKLWDSISASLKARKGEFTGTSGNEAKISNKINSGNSVNISNPTSQRTFHRDASGSLLDQQIDIGNTGEGDVGEIVSSAIDNIDYDPTNEIASVTFHNGKKAYDYKVSPKEMEEMINADSKGSWLNNIWKYYNRMPGY